MAAGACPTLLPLMECSRATTQQEQTVDERIYPQDSPICIANLCITMFEYDFCDEPIQYDLTTLVSNLRKQFGHDGAMLSEKDLELALTTPHASDRWRDIGWSCRETIFEFARKQCDSIDDYICGVAMSCLLAEAVKRNGFPNEEGRWSRDCLDAIITMTYLNMNIISSQFREVFFKYLFAPLKNTDSISN